MENNYNYQQQSGEYRIKQLADSAFGKGLASVIMSGFPIVSIFAIFMAIAGKKASNEADALAKTMNVSAGGKNIAARILSIIGLVESIVCTCIYAFYFFYMFFIIMLVISGVM